MRGDDATDRLDAALRSLRPSSGIDDKLATLRELVEYWHGPLKPGDGMPDAELAGLALPRPLAWWYRWAGRRGSIMSGQNFLFQPGKADYPHLRLAETEGRLDFQIENQACYFWSTLPEGDDPPVFGRASEHEPWEKERVTLSEHLILNCMFEAVLCHAEYRASSVWSSELKLNAIAERAPALAIGPWRWCETHFFAGSGVFMAASPVGEEHDTRYFSIFIGAKHAGRLDFIEPLVEELWETAEF